MIRCWSCGAMVNARSAAAAPDACRNLFDAVTADEYPLMAFDDAIMAAHRLTGAAYVVQHARKFPGQSVAFSWALLRAVLKDDEDPILAAERLHPLYEPDQLPDPLAMPPVYKSGVVYEVRVDNFLPDGDIQRITSGAAFKSEDYLAAAYRWATSAFRGPQTS